MTNKGDNQSQEGTQSGTVQQPTSGDAQAEKPADGAGEAAQDAAELFGPIRRGYGSADFEKKSK